MDIISLRIEAKASARESFVTLCLTVLGFRVQATVLVGVPKALTDWVWNLRLKYSKDPMGLLGW